MSPPDLRFFHFKHLPEPLRSTSREFHDLAHYLASRDYDPSAQRDAGFQKLIEAKDCFVRCERIGIGGEPEPKPIVD